MFRRSIYDHSYEFRVLSAVVQSFPVEPRGTATPPMERFHYEVIRLQLWVAATKGKIEGATPQIHLFRFVAHTI